MGGKFYVYTHTHTQCSSWILTCVGKIFAIFNAHSPYDRLFEYNANKTSSAGSVYYECVVPSVHVTKEKLVAPSN